MAITKIQSESLNLADDYTFTGTVAGAGGNNRPAFRAYMSSDFTTAMNGSYYLMSCNTEDFDTDSCYNNSTYKFTPTVAGKYYVYGNAYIYRTDGSLGLNYANVRIAKNGSDITNVSMDTFSDPTTGMGMFTSTVVDMNGTSDYLQLYARGYGAGANCTITGSSKDTYFGAYKIIT